MSNTQDCQRCKYVWEYTGKKTQLEYSQYTTCPKCLTKVVLKFDKLKGGRK